MIGHIHSNTARFDSTLGNHTSDQALVRSIAEGNKSALKLLYLRHRERVYRFVVGLTGMGSVADGVVNEVFLLVRRHAGEFEGKSQVAIWLLGIARFKAISECRHRCEAPLDERAAEAIVDPANSLALSAKKRARSDILQKCVAKLTLHRDVLNLIYYQGQ